MSEVKTITILSILGGKATTEDARMKARQLYPDTELARIIHNPLKELARKGYVKAEIPAKYKSIRQTIWSINPHAIQRDAQDETMNKRGRKISTKARELLKAMEGSYQKIWEPNNLILKREPNFDKQEEEEDDTKIIESKTPVYIRPETPEFKTAAELLERSAISSIPALAEVQEEEDPRYVETMEKLKDAILVKNGTISDQIKEAIKEPYLDNLQNLADTVESKTMHYRGRHDIVFDILRFLREKGEEVNPTNIMYGCRLPVSQFNKFMAIVVKNGLVEKIPLSSRYVYKLTPKGYEYATWMDKIKIDFD